VIAKLGDLRDIILLAMAAAVLVVLAISGAIDHDTTKNGLLVFLGVIGGAVTTTAKPSVP
jgi:hypothetical protein